MQIGLKKHDIKLEYSARVKGVIEHGNGEGATLTYTDKKGNERTIHGDKVLVTVGRKPNTQGYGLDNICVDMDGCYWVIGIDVIR